MSRFMLPAFLCLMLIASASAPAPDPDSWNVPSQVFMVATYPYRAPIYSWQVTACSGMSIGQKGMMVAAKTLAATVIDLFRNPSVVEAAKNDLEAHRKGHPFHLLTPPNHKPPVVAEAQ